MAIPSTSIPEGSSPSALANSNRAPRSVSAPTCRASGATGPSAASTTASAPGSWGTSTAGAPPGGSPLPSASNRAACTDPSAVVASSWRTAISEDGLPSSG
jgi:hypothetical protein